MSVNHVRHHGFFVVAVVALVMSTSASASGQTASATTETEPGTITVATGVDFANTYMFRGFRQDDTKIMTWPYAGLGLALYSGDGVLKGIGVDVGTWNGFHPGDAGTHGRSGKLWYESRLFGTVGLQFGRGVSVGTTYTMYKSPNDMFTTVKEVGVKLGVDDRVTLRGAAVKPYALIAFEIDTAPGVGQLDGGWRAGKYLELGAAPTYSGKRVSVGFPLKVGLSLGDYYELAGRDNTFGFVSVAGILTVPLGGTTSIGRWNLHGGLEFQSLGETTKVLNGGDRSKVIASFGFGVTR